MKKAMLFVAVVAGFLMPYPAHALCVGTSLSGVPGSATFQGAAGEYDPYDATEYMQTVNFSVTSVASVGGCRYYVTLSAGSSGNTAQRTMILGPDHIDYNVYKTFKTAILDSAGAYNGANVISGNFAFILGVGQSNAHSFFWTITPQQLAAADSLRFEDTNLTLRVWAELALNVFTNTDTQTITFRARPESNVALSLVDTGSAINLADTAQTVDFGTLASGQVRAYDTLIRSNDGYVVTLQSQNHQVLRHALYPVVATTVPYSVTFGGAAVDLSSGSAVTAATSTGTTPATGDRFEARFTAGTLSGAEIPGNYQDIITVTVSAN